MGSSSLGLMSGYTGNEKGKSSELHNVSKNSYPPQKVTLFGNRMFGDVIS